MSSGSTTNEAQENVSDEALAAIQELNVRLYSNVLNLADPDLTKPRGRFDLATSKFYLNDKY